MNLLDAILLGIVQGLTEFLPVSSSGHLELGKALVGDESMPENSLLFTVVVHFATALSTMIIFRKEVTRILVGLLQFKRNEEFTLSVKIIVSMIPAGLVGLLLAEEIEQLFNRQILLVGVMLLVTAVLLVLADRVKYTGRSIGYSQATTIGVAQAIAILPGISRSGATISTSVLLGIDRSQAASFSFLMVVPLIFGKIAKDILDGALTLHDGQGLILLTGFSAAFLTGLVACTWMVKLVRDSQLKYFSYYCAVVGSAAIIYHLVS